jgi:hypothetical protein
MENLIMSGKKRTAKIREKIIDFEIIPKIKMIFNKYLELQSAMILVAQYWDDEAGDAVHYRLIFSVLPTPVLGIELIETDDSYDLDPVNLPGLPNLDDICYSVDDFYGFVDGEYCWNDNGNAIPAFAAYCKEGCHQDMDYSEAYSPYAVFRRKAAEIEIEVVGTMLRPWLDGTR